MGERAEMAPGSGRPSVDDRGGDARSRRSTRDLGQLRDALERWMRARLGDSADPRISQLDAPPSNGLSSETLLFEAGWSEGHSRRSERLVARVAPDPDAMPVFPVYDLDRQARIMRTVREAADVPVPRVYWSEPDPEALGGPFIVMERVDGVVPPDLMPYNFGSWLSQAAVEDQMRLQEATIGILARVHAIRDPDRRFPYLHDARAGSSALRRHVSEQRAFYEWVVSDGLRSPLLEEGFAWLERHWPDDEGETVLNWGDARIGNVIYREFEPVAVLDWEMTSLNPREVDVGWMIFLHRFFEDVAAAAGLPGMPHLLRREDVATTYHRLTGHAPRDLDFYTMYAALRHGIIMSRIERRAIHLGQSARPADVDDLIMHRATLERMLEGRYWSEIS